jgi:hypothetical protein
MLREDLKELARTERPTVSPAHCVTPERNEIPKPAIPPPIKRGKNYKASPSQKQKKKQSK